MPRLRTRTPRLCRDRQQAYVKVNGQRIQLGRWASDQAQEAYDRTIAEWLANGRKAPPPTIENEPITVTELVVAYWRSVKDRQPGHPTRRALQLLRKLYGSEPAESFGPKRLRVLRDDLIRRRLARATIVEYVRCVRACFRWGAATELIDEKVYRRLTALEALRQRDVLQEARKVRPVPRADLRRVRPLLTRPVRALVDLQLLTGARADELVRLAATDLDRSGKVWTYAPTKHKTAHKSKDRTIYFGPRAQRVLNLFMRSGRPLDRPLFDPRESNAEAKRCDAKGERRPNQKPNPTADGSRWRNRHSEGYHDEPRAIGDHYTTPSYRRAIHRACKTAGVSQWGPHRLRHNAATFLRRQFGIDVASVILGHSSLAVTATYAELNDRKAREVIAKVG